jgi:hypothetical protein
MVGYSRCLGWSTVISWLLSARDLLVGLSLAAYLFLWSILLHSLPEIHCALLFLGTVIINSCVQFFTFRLIAFFRFPFHTYFWNGIWIILTSVKENSCSWTFITFFFSLFSAQLEDNKVTTSLSGIIEEWYQVFHINKDFWLFWGW